jgi:hypothetical protein
MQPIRPLLANVVGTACGPTGVDPEVAPDGPAQWLQAGDELSFTALLTASAHLGASDPIGLRPMDPWPTLWAAVDYRGATGVARNS